ncbi:glycoside hydrolase family 55 protein [Streptomyces sp. NBC_01216]|uniref:hypothetical protein n=1 Tax=Streptomyces sp. NBC_01216 TaxID=2903778 RepID=UPI002E1284D6|nr:glycoside hydrolase family 55 protein [Streptomyces sp. NBC_01216]
MSSPSTDHTSPADSAPSARAAESASGHETGRRPGRRTLLAGLTGAGAVAGGLALGTRSAVAVPAAVTATAGPYVVDVVAKGADPTGATPSDAAFRAAVAEMLGGAPGTGVTPGKVLLIPPGTYLLTEPDLLPPTQNTDPAEHSVVNGISISGFGKRLSHIVYDPTVRDTVLWRNMDRYKNIRISGLTFESRDSTATFNRSYSSATFGVQDTWYADVEWRGTWKAGIVLDGPKAGKSNLNSEMGWDHCQISGSYADAFLVMGTEPAEQQQDQFLNYWFRDCKVEFQSGVFVRNEHGGSMNFIGGSYILTDPNSTGTFFELNANPPRSDSVMRLYAQGIRFEVRGTGHKVIDSSWYKGTITFVSCDDTAHSFKSWAVDAVPHQYRFDAVSPSRGPMIRYQDCALLGSHQVTAAGTTTAGKLLYDGCRFNNMTTGTGASGFLRWPGAAPWYEFRDCAQKSGRLPDAKMP